MRLRWYLIALVVELAVVYNIERVDFGQRNVIDVQSFVYVLTLAVVMLVITVPLLYKAPFGASLALTVLAYSAIKVFVLNDRPFIGGVYTYLSITEVGLLLISVWLAWRVGRALRDFENAVENVTLSTIGRMEHLDGAAKKIQTELIRSRRHHRPLSVVVVKPQPESVRAVLHRAVQEVQRTMMKHYVFVSLAGTIGKELRRTDLIVEHREGGRYIIFSPETNVFGSRTLVERIQAISEKAGVSVACGFASFPDDALTFDELVKQAQGRIGRSELAAEAQPGPAEAAKQRRGR